jgi:hypothetical protein
MAKRRMNEEGIEGGHVYTYVSLYACCIIIFSSIPYTYVYTYPNMYTFIHMHAHI